MDKNILRELYAEFSAKILKRGLFVLYFMLDFPFKKSKMYKYPFI